MLWNPKDFINLWFSLCLIWGLPSFAAQEAPQTWTLDGKLYQTGNSNPLLDSAAKIKVQILDPSGACLLYEEQQTVDTRTTSGYFSIHVGSATGNAKRTVNDPGRSMIQIFQNQTGISANSAPGQTCPGGVYSPALGAVRYFRLIVTPSETNVADTLTPDIVIDSVPNALIAQSVQGLERSNILQTSVSASTALTQSNLEALFTTPAYTNLQAILGGNFMKTDSSGASLPSYAADPAGVSNGDIWFDTTTNEIKYKTAGGVQTVGASGGGSISSLTVGSSMSINGTVAGTISSSGTIDLSNTGVAAGTYAKVTVDTKGRVTAGTISLVEADIPNLTAAGKVSGNTITSGTISGSAGVNTSGNLISTGTVSGLTVQATNLRVYNGTNYVELVAPTLAGIVNFTLPDNDGNPGDVLTSNGSGVLSWAPSSSTLAGDVSGPSSATSVDKIKGKAVTAASVSGQIMIYDGTVWTNNVVSGDATLAHNGIFTLNRVPVSKGGTNTATFGNNRIIASNGTGSALVDFTCPLNQVITFDASGNSACANVSSLITALVNGGNTTGGTISVGSNDNHALQLKTNGTVAMSISQGGYVGIGTASPAEKLEVNGGIKLGTTFGTNAGTIRWDGANFQGYDGTAWSNFTLPAPPAGACDTTVNFTTAGTYNYTVPASFGTITIQLWGGGGGGGGSGSSGPAADGSAGGTTSVVSLGLTAMGGSGGLGSGTGGAGGTASGGTTNTTGSIGATAIGTTGGTGGTAPNGGAGGTGTLLNNGNNGYAPGGGGAGGGYSYSGGGGGGGGYVSKTFTSATLIPGSNLAGIVVGGGGTPALGWGGRNGGYGAIGKVSITCASAGAAPINDRGIVFWDSGTHASSTTFVHDASGNVGVGTATPTAKLDVVGQARTTASGGAAKVNTSAAVDWNNGNAQSMSVACTTTTFTNMLDGGTYILAVSETGTTTCTFSQAGLTFFYNPANGARTSGQRTVYTFQRIGTDVYVSWIPGFQ